MSYFCTEFWRIQLAKLTPSTSPAATHWASRETACRVVAENASSKGGKRRYFQNLAALGAQLGSSHGVFGYVGLVGVLSLLFIFFPYYGITCAEPFHSNNKDLIFAPKLHIAFEKGCARALWLHLLG